MLIAIGIGLENEEPPFHYARGCLPIPRGFCHSQGQANSDIKDLKILSFQFES